MALPDTGATWGQQGCAGDVSKKTLVWPRRDQRGQKGPDAAFQGCWAMPLFSSSATQTPCVTPAQELEELSSLGMGCGAGSVPRAACAVLGAGATPGTLCCDSSQCSSRSLTKTQTPSEHALLCFGAEGPVQPQPWLSTMLIRFVQAARSHPAVHNFNCLLHNCLSNICSVVWHDLPAKLQQE